LGLIDEILAGSRISFDANTLIYYVEEHPDFFAVVDPLFESILAGTFAAYLSVIILTEVLVAPLRDGAVTLADRYRAILNRTRGFSTQTLDEQTAERAALIRSQYTLRTPDAVVAATAIGAACTHLVTKDARFRRVNEFNTLVISDFV